MLTFLVAIATLASIDTDMTPLDMQQTGVSKLSEQERDALQNWIDEKYFKKSSKARKKQIGPTLNENLNSGKLIRLSDGSLWEINPADTPITQSWITPVEIKEGPSEDPQYPAKLTNTLTGSSVKAKEV